MRQNTPAKTTSNGVKILGIDPGHSRIGFGFITDKPSFKVIDAGVIEIKPDDMPKKLLELVKAMRRLLKKYRPDVVAVETLFFSKNRKTALAVAEARGVILLAAEESGCMVREFNPLEVKRVVGGYGNIDKTSLCRVIELLLKTKLPKGPDDLSDAVAIALAAALTSPLNQHTRF